MRQRSPNVDEERAIRDTALREAWPYTDSRANYEIAARARTAQAEGRERAHA
ncbi:hypothetical protein ACFQFC_36125 [Amorphoplanes digitatis]|uniref:Uncharacterized protein n=1 Tax=Actinoplanes digitatis TaxID=1868 RepID=A0A7W7MNZ4_9ACTN|nr:hypothetical protein [Actinoplanes digitatis]MBB4761588.1 hypothetical protein [Actinoplanes digitatis]GID90697.1 hypothetical protein Adi01nite_01090 [Actinoplanes digitatis]